MAGTKPGGVRIIARLFLALRLRFGLRHGTACRPSRTCARRNRSPYAPAAPFAVVQRDGLPMIEPRAAR